MKINLDFNTVSCTSWGVEKANNQGATLKDS